METTELKDIAEAKLKDRRERAKLPFIEKIRAVVRMQKRHAEIARLRGKTVRVWDIDL
jgi:hypothetical protein